MKKVVLYMLIFSTFISCTKKEDEDSPETNPSSYLPMKIGNYWVYGHYDIDTLGNETLQSRLDSFSISGIMKKNNNTYFVFSGTYFPLYQSYEPIIWALRDSSGYIVDTTGRILFAENDFRDSIETYFLTQNSDTIVSWVFQMKKVLAPLNTPAGIFIVLNYHALITTYSPLQIPSYIPNPRDWNKYYSKGVGIVLETYFYTSQPGYSERRLLRYSVK